MTDAQLIHFVAGFRRGLLGRRSSRGQCTAVCLPLAGLLSVHGVAVDVISGGLPPELHGDIANHTWLRLPDGRALDPTADQFGGPRVYLGSPLAYHQGSAG